VGGVGWGPGKDTLSMQLYEHHAATHLGD
jgi:hypothetical protein